MALTARIKRIFGNDALDWLDRSYLTDWIVVASFWILSELAGNLPVFERDFYVADPVINHPHKKSQIGGTLNHFIALLVPAAMVLAVGLLRLSFVTIHHGILALLAGRGMTRLFTNVLKNRVGRLRPDFLARCKWDEVVLKCTGKKSDVLDGRRSFPSGHSSAAFAGMTFLSFWLAGQTAAWCFHAPLPVASLRSSRLVRFCLTLFPLWWAIFVAVTRLEDYRHHKEDVITGAIIGALCSAICYLAFWPSPFSSRSFTTYEYGQPRLISSENDHRRRANDFELTRLEEDDMDV
ncbi:lipid phosphate phosphatase 1 [Mycena albidolilacea]|uniref:Lipid phosphate phosphatase 1 n=1 Tax=Mycena albidolilacea TaxID=1033008 RepID=A0AAD7ELY9_9AGAR|nr:lipid phosphate phosphatase 1 [Mycena albidolilacea]